MVHTYNYGKICKYGKFYHNCKIIFPDLTLPLFYNYGKTYSIAIICILWYNRIEQWDKITGNDLQYFSVIPQLKINDATLSVAILQHQNNHGIFMHNFEKVCNCQKIQKCIMNVYELSDNSEFCRNCVGNCQNCLSFGKQLWIVRQFWIFRQWGWLSKGRKACHFISPQYVTPQSQKKFFQFF